MESVATPCHTPLGLADSGGAQNEMNSRIGPNWATHVTDLQSIRRLLEGLLHLSSSEGSQVSSSLGGAAVGEFGGQFLESLLSGLDLLLIALEYLQCLFLRPGDVVAPPTRRATGLAVLHQQMGRLHFGVPEAFRRRRRSFPLRFFRQQIQEVRFTVRL